MNEHKEKSTLCLIFAHAEIVVKTYAFDLCII